ncbi:aminoacyl-histidine dipeptidase [Lachnospiraceae bacterium 46-61]
MGVLESLEPKSVFYFFEEICSIPHGSRNEKKLSDYIVHFAEKRGLYYKQDEQNNVLIKKKATQGYESKPTIILQAHIDMVCEKNGNVEHDFEKDGLKLIIEDGKIKADGTTLGADNGIGVAYMLAILDAENIAHPDIEAIFTTEEEIGMGGAKEFDASDLKGKIFINLDSEEQGELVISCCGGNKTNVLLPIVWEETPEWGIPYLLKITGLKGGHSGTDIHLQRANANKLMGRILLQIFNVYDIRICSILGGEKDNAIPREAETVLLLKLDDVEAIKKMMTLLNKALCNEYKQSENNISVSLLPMTEKVGECFSKDTVKKLISILLLLPYGIETMDTYTDLVESSSNIGAVKTEEQHIIFCNAIRSSVASKQRFITQKIDIIAKLTGAETKVTGEYPEWPAKKESHICKVCQQIYKELYKQELVITSVHAGLECGIFSGKLKDIDMVSFGPNITGAHSPDEKADIDSIIKIWEFLLKVIAYKN